MGQSGRHNLEGGQTFGKELFNRLFRMDQPGYVDEGRNDAFDALGRNIRRQSGEVGTRFGGLVFDPQFFGCACVKDLAEVIVKAGVIERGGQISQRPARVGRDNVEQLGGCRREIADAQTLVEKNRGDFRAGEQISQVAVGAVQFIDLMVQLLIDRLQFLVQRLHFFLGRFKLLVARLHFLVRARQALHWRISILQARSRIPRSSFAGVRGFRAIRFRSPPRHRVFAVLAATPRRSASAFLLEQNQKSAFDRPRVGQGFDDQGDQFGAPSSDSSFDVVPPPARRVSPPRLARRAEARRSSLRAIVSKLPGRRSRGRFETFPGSRGKIDDFAIVVHDHMRRREIDQNARLDRLAQRAPDRPVRPGQMNAERCRAPLIGDERHARRLAGVAGLDTDNARLSSGANRSVKRPMVSDMPRNRKPSGLSA